MVNYYHLGSFSAGPSPVTGKIFQSKPLFESDLNGKVLSRSAKGPIGELIN
jgi:hypothetical protein